jgi:hypothetical protein
MQSFLFLIVCFNYPNLSAMKIEEVDIENMLESFTRLSKNDFKILMAIYNSPGCLLTSKELQRKYRILPVRIGQLGKKLGKLCGVTDFGTYKDGKKIKVAYFKMIGEYYKDAGWALSDVIRIAIKKHLNEQS